MPVFIQTPSGAHANEEDNLASQEKAVRLALTANADQLLAMLMTRMRELQQDTSKKMGVELAAVKKENERLRSELSLASENGGGTGDTGGPGLPSFLKDANNWSRPQTPLEKPRQPPPSAAPLMIAGAGSPTLPQSGHNGRRKSQMSHMLDHAEQHSHFEIPHLELDPEEETMGHNPSSAADFKAFRQHKLERKNLIKACTKQKEKDEHVDIAEPDGTQTITGKNVRPTVKNVRPTQGCFADANAMKEKVRAAVAKKEYSVFDYYYETGWPQHIARSQRFEYITLAVIASNALWISIDADNNESATVLNADPIFAVAEHTFCIYFTFEWLMRFLSFKRKRNGCKDGWFVFDSALVAMMVSETWIMTIVLMATSSGSGETGLGDTSILKLVRLARLTRMARMAKLLRAVPELVILIKGMVVASRSVSFTLILLTILTYFFGIVFRQLTDGTAVGDEFFSSVPESMMSLLLDGVLPDQAGIVRTCGDDHWFFGLLALFFVLLSGLMVMNMLVGVLCEVVSVVSTVEKESLCVNYVKQRLQQMFGDWDEDGNLMISREEFERLLLVPDAAMIIQEIGVDVIGLVDFADFIFKDDEELSFASFMELILSLRGSNQSTVKDVVDLRKFVISELSTTREETVLKVEEILNASAQQQAAAGAAVCQRCAGAGSFNNFPPSPNHGIVAPVRPYSQPHSGSGPGGRPVVQQEKEELSGRFTITSPYVAEDNSGAKYTINKFTPESGQQFVQRPLSGQEFIQRPASGESGESGQQVLARLRNRNLGQAARNATEQNRRDRLHSPPLPNFPQQLWMDEQNEIGDAQIGGVSPVREGQTNYRVNGQRPGSR